jgi:hypothetical protein
LALLLSGGHKYATSTSYLSVQGREFPGGAGVRVQERGQEPDLQSPELGAFRRVLDAPQQVRAGAGEPDEAVHGEEAAVGEVQLLRTGRVLQLVSQGVLPVEVAADDDGPPPPGAGVQQPGGPQQRLGASGRNAEFLREQWVVEQFQGVPSIWVISRPNAVPPVPAEMSPRAASASTMARVGASRTGARLYMESWK